MGGVFSGVRALVFEEEMLIGIMMEDQLRELGCDVAGVVRDAERAAALLGRDGVDVAFVELGLEEQVSLALAGRARDAGARIVFTTAEPRDAAPSGFECCPVLTKPFAPVDLAGALRRALVLPPPAYPQPAG